MQPEARVKKVAKRQAKRTYSGLHVSDEVIAVLIFLQSSERHLCTGDVLVTAPNKLGQQRALHDVAEVPHLFGVLQVVNHRVLAPCDTLADVRRSV